jgi:hypothetical protein
MHVIVMRKGYDRLWSWFSLSSASFLTLPRVMMHEMPDEWQGKMAALLEEWDNTWDSYELPTPSVNAKKDGKFTKWPNWVLNYRHPDRYEVEKLRVRGA